MSTRAKVIIILVFIVLFFVGIIYSIKSAIKLNAGQIKITSNSLLHISLSGELKDRANERPGFLGGQMEISLQSLREALNYAANDSRIKAVILEPNVIQAGFGKIQELGQLIQNFKEKSGKPVFAYLEFCFPKEYYLATFCDSIYAVPTGNVLINGLASSVYYVKQGLSKIGIQADFVAIGKYKNAPEMFTRDRLTDDQKEVMQDFLNQYFHDFLKTIAANRGMDQAKVKKLIDIGLFSSEKAKEYGLVDHLIYPDELIRKFGKDVLLVDAQKYAKKMREENSYSSANKIAIIFAQGTIYPGKGDLEGNIFASSFLKMIDKIRKDHSIKAVVLRMDSPGGSATASEIIWNSLMKLKKKMPVIVSVSDMAASGGYYMAMVGDSIVAEPGSIVGSIGVFAGKFSFHGLYSKLGIRKETLFKGKNALMFDENRPFSPSERQILTENLENFYKTFVQKVANARNKSWEEIHAIAQGRIWTGTEGVQNGLVDRLGGLDDAIKLARDMAGFLEDESVQLVYYPRKKPFFQKLLEQFQASEDPIEELMPNGISKGAVHFFVNFSKFKPLETLAILPFYMEVK